MTLGRQPSALRILAACLAASAAAAAPTLLLGLLAIFAFPVGLIIAGAHMILLGLPTYLIVRRYRPVDWPQALIAGFVIGLAPMSLWQLLVLAADSYEYLSVFVMLAAGGLGALGGVVFRVVIGTPVDPRSGSEVASVFD